MRGHRIKEAREAMGLTQVDLARRIGVHYNQILRYEKNAAIPSAENLRAIALELNVSMDWLAGLVDNPLDHLQPSDITPEEARLLDAFRSGDWRRVLRLLAEPSPEGKHTDT